MRRPEQLGLGRPFHRRSPLQRQVPRNHGLGRLRSSKSDAGDHGICPNREDRRRRTPLQGPARPLRSPTSPRGHAGPPLLRRGQGAVPRGDGRLFVRAEKVQGSGRRRRDLRRRRRGAGGQRVALHQRLPRRCREAERAIRRDAVRTWRRRRLGPGFARRFRRRRDLGLVRLALLPAHEFAEGSRPDRAGDSERRKRGASAPAIRLRPPAAARKARAPPPPKAGPRKRVQSGPKGGRTLGALT
mmetsp:Transcript_3650/g.11102  ORF Transcript_3650/g.11102 Transcript_3650/m.11102 type:complete len:243 (-) Transcript_3650:37-765(-)